MALTGRKTPCCRTAVLHQLRDFQVVLIDHSPGLPLYSLIRSSKLFVICFVVDPTACTFGKRGSSGHAFPALIASFASCTVRSGNADWKRIEVERCNSIKGPDHFGMTGKEKFGC